jgi:tetratricopeptide (TPR) repeat protein
MRSFYAYILLLLTPVSLHLSASESSGKNLLDQKELVAFANQIEMSIESRNPYFFNLSFDSEAIIKSILENSLSESDSGFNQGFIDGFKQTLDLGAFIISEIGNNGTFEFISCNEDKDGPWITFRLLSENGINYHAYKVVTIGDNYKITDAYFFLSGEKLSESLQQIYDRNAAVYLQKETECIEMIQAKNELDRVKEYFSKGKINKAYKSWSEIPAVYRMSKSFQYVGLTIAPGLDKETYLSIYKEYLKNYPEEWGKYLIPLDGLVKEGYTELALQCIGKLEKTLKRDPLLDFFRAKIYYSNGNIEEATTFLGRVIDLIPDFEMGYVSLLNIYLTEKKFLEATILLNQMTLTFNTYKEDLYPYLSDFPEYLNSPVYKEWIEQ